MNVPNSYILQIGNKSDFVLFNPLEIELIDIEPILSEIYIENNKFWNNLRSITWSSGCIWFIVLFKECMIICNVYSDTGYCGNHSRQIINEYINTSVRKKKL